MADLGASRHAEARRLHGRGCQGCLMKFTQLATQPGPTELRANTTRTAYWEMLAVFVLASFVGWLVLRRAWL